MVGGLGLRLIAADDGDEWSDRVDGHFQEALDGVQFGGWLGNCCAEPKPSQLFGWQ